MRSDYKGIGRMRTLAELQNKKTKRNGCTCPPHPLQLLTYLILTYQFAVTCTLIAPLLSSDSRVTLS